MTVRQGLTKACEVGVKTPARDEKASCQLPLCIRTVVSICLLIFLPSGASAQEIIAEFQSRNTQVDLYAIPFGDSILFSYEEIIGPNRPRVREVKWVSRDGTTNEIFCPQKVFAIEAEGNTIYHYYRDGKSLKALAKSADSQTMVDLPQSIQLDDVIVLATYVNENFFLVLLSEDRRTISVMEIAGMNVVRTTTYNPPIELADFIKKNTYIELYDEPSLASFKGRARVKMFLTGNDIDLVIDERHTEPATKDPDITHVLRLEDGSVTYHKFPWGKGAFGSDFGSFLFDGILFQNRTSKEKFSLTAFDMSGKQLMQYDIRVDSVDMGKKDSVKVNYRWGRENFQGWDTFRQTFKQAGASDPLIVVSANDGGYRVQWGTYYDENGTGSYAGSTPLTAMITFFVTTAIKQVSEGPGMSRYWYFDTDLRSGKILPVEEPPSGLLRAKIDEFEKSRQVKNKSRFESKSYIPFQAGVVAIYRLKPEKMIGVTQLVYFAQ